MGASLRAKRSIPGRRLRRLHNVALDCLLAAFPAMTALEHREKALACYHSWRAMARSLRRTRAMTERVIASEAKQSRANVSLIARFCPWIASSLTLLAMTAVSRLNRRNIVLYTTPVSAHRGRRPVSVPGGAGGKRRPRRGQTESASREALANGDDAFARMRCRRVTRPSGTMTGPRLRSLKRAQVAQKAKPRSRRCGTQGTEKPRIGAG